VADRTDPSCLGAENGSYRMHPAKHSIVLADNTYHGQIRVGITFTAAAQAQKKSKRLTWSGNKISW
jgi:hypothetical protein